MKILFFVLLVGFNLIGSDFQLELSISSREVILGERIYVCLESEYTGGKVETIAEDAFTLEIFIEKIDGFKLKEKIKRKIESIKSLYNKFIEIENGWKKRKCEELSSKYYIDLGEYYIWGRVISEGPYNEKVGNRIIEKEGWEGKVETKKEMIRVIYPQGEDKEAYEYFKGEVPLSGERTKEVLEKFPTSTYAGWVLVKTSNGLGFIYHSGKELIDDILRNKNERKEIRGIYKKENGKMKYYSPEELAERYIISAEMYLNFHSESILSSLVNAKLGMSYLLLKEWDKAYIPLKNSLRKEWPVFLYDYKDTLKNQKKLVKETLEEIKKRRFIKE